MIEQQEHIPWWQRELNARLARRALRREALRRLAVRAVGALALMALGLQLVLALAQDTQGQLAERTRHIHRAGALASVAPSPTPVSVDTATAAIGKLRASGATLTLDPPATGTASANQGAKLRVTLTDRAGTPLPGITIWLTITGLLPYSGVATTDTGGVASFPYQGNGSPYSVHITATANGSQLAQSTVPIAPAPGVATTEVTGRFYASDDRCTFDIPANTPPLFIQRFPTINFAGRPFTGYGTGPDSRAITAASGRNVVGVGPLNHFNAIFTGSLVVRHAGNVLFTFLIDDAFNLGLGGGAIRVSGALSNPPASGLTALQRLPVIGAFNQGHLEATTHVTVHFPRPGSFPYEVDYSECMAGHEMLRISTGGLFLPTAL